MIITLVFLSMLLLAIYHSNIHCIYMIYDVIYPFLLLYKFAVSLRIYILGDNYKGFFMSQSMY